MSTVKRDKPFIWVTWLTALITGEKQCEFQSWFKTRFKQDKKPGNFQLTQWNVKHNQLVHKNRDALEAAGYEVNTEDQNSFKMIFPSGVALSGKSDIVAIKDARGLVVDCKTGKPKTSDQIQVVLYMMFLSKCIKEYEDIIFDGRVVYLDGNVNIFWRDIDSGLKDVIQDYIDRLSKDEPCRKVPSWGECRFCDLTKQECSERMG